MATLEVAEFVTIEGLAMCETGIAYPASTGPISLTSQMFASAVEFAQDPHGLAPRIKISHGANPINEDLQSLFDAYNAERDGSEPALGTILNLRTANAGHTLVGDWYGLPKWLADILQSAYPARSIEGGTWQNEANQKSYDFIVEACVLLGVVGPGCTSLADVQELFSAAGPKVTVIEMSHKETTQTGGKLRMPAALQVNVEDIRRSFYNEFAQGDRYWWWDRELLSEPWEFICSDDNGDLWRVPFEVEQDEDGDTIVSSWGEPQPIKIQYTKDVKREGEEVAAVRMISAQIPNAGTVLAVNNNPLREKQKEAKPAMGIDIPALRERLGVSEEDLPDDATEEQINAALAAEPEPEDDSEDSTSKDEAAAVAAAKGNVITVDREIWEQTRRGAELAITQQQERDRGDNTTFLETAVREGRISRAARDSYLTQMNGPDNSGRGPARDAIKAMIEQLPKGVAMPVEEVGHGESEPLTTDTQMGTGLFPKLEEARARRVAGQEA